LSGERGVDAAVIEFDALADAIRSPAENHHLLFLGRAPFVVAAVVSRVVVGRVSLELGGAGVHETVSSETKPSFFRSARTSSSVWPVKLAISGRKNRATWLWRVVQRSFVKIKLGKANCNWERVSRRKRQSIEESRNERRGPARQRGHDPICPKP